MIFGFKKKKVHPLNSDVRAGGRLTGERRPRFTFLYPVTQ